MISRNQKLEFLNTKLQLMAAYLDASVVEALRLLIGQVSKNAYAIPISAFGDIDRELEKIINGHISPTTASSIGSTLMSRFGYASLTRQPDPHLTAIIQRRKILNEEEAKLIQDYLAGDYGGYKLNGRTQSQLGEMLNAYEQIRNDRRSQ